MDEDYNEEVRRTQAAQGAEQPAQPKQPAPDPYMAYLQALHRAQVAAPAAEPSAAEAPAAAPPQAPAASEAAFAPAPAAEVPAADNSPAQATPFAASAYAAAYAPQTTPDAVPTDTVRYSPAQPDAPQTTGNEPRYGMDRLTPQQYYSADSRPAPVREEPKTKKKVSRAWIPILLITALLLGLAGTFIGYRLAKYGSLFRTSTPTEPEESQSSTLPSPTVPEPSREPISDDIRTNENEGTNTPAEVYRKNVDAVVGIASESTGSNVWGQTVTQASSGSGFIITADGYVVTNYHVVEGANSITVQLHDGTEYPATVVGYESTTCDVALLKIEAEGLPTVSVGNSDTVCVGHQVCAIGNPLGELTFTLTVGYISALDREINTDGTPINMFQTDAAINSGNSGGPLFDMSGNVIGITTAKYSGSTSNSTIIEGLGFAIPINDIMAIIDDLTQYGYVTGKPYLGVTVGDSLYYGENLPAGAYIAQVVEDYAAYEAGLQAGDVIVGIGEAVVGSQADLLAALSAYEAGDSVSLTYFRNGQYSTVTVTLDERPKDVDVPQQTEPAVDENPIPEETFDPFGGFGWMFP